MFSLGDTPKSTARIEWAEWIESLTAALQAQWGVRLWRIRFKNHRVKIKLEAPKPVDERALHAWLVQQLSAQTGTSIEVSITFSSVAECCGSNCQGCLIGNPSSHASLGTKSQARYDECSATVLAEGSRV